MKKIYRFHVFLIGMILTLVCTNSAFAVSYTWNGSVSSDWNTAANWSPAGVPGISDDVTINSTGGANDPMWDELPGIRNLTMSARTLDLQGFALQVSGTATLSGGTMTSGSLLITSTNTATFSGTVFYCSVSYTGNTPLLNGGTFHAPVTIVKNAGGTVNCAGGATFNSTLSLSNSSGSAIRLGTTSADTFNGIVTFTNTGAGGIYPAYTSIGNQFNENIVVNSTGAGGVRFGQNGGTSALATGKTISVGGSGFSSGILALRYFTQNGAGTWTLNGTGSAYIQFEAGSVMNAEITATWPNVLLNGTTFNTNVTLTKTSATGNTSTGGNTYGGTFRFTNQGNANYYMANVNPDIFNGDVYFDNEPTANFTLAVARTAVGNQFNGNIYLNNSTGTLTFGAASGTSTLAAGKTIQLFSTGMPSGTITLSRLTQLGNAAVSFTQTTGSGILNLSNGTTLGGAATFQVPQLALNGAIFNSTFVFTKVGNTGTTSNGGNTFNAAATFNNSTSAQLIYANVSPDIFNSTLTVNNTGSAVMHFSRTAAGNEYRGNIAITSTGSSQGVRFGQNGGTSVLFNGAHLSYASVNSGNQIFRGFTFQGTDAYTFTMSGTATLQFETGTVFNCPVTINAANAYFNGATFNGNVIFNRSGSAAATSNGGNTFNGAFTLNAAGNGGITFANAAADIFNGTLTINNTQTTGAVSFSRNAAGNQINGNLILSNTSSGGIGFGSGGGTTTMADGYTLSLGGAYTAGPLNLRGFTKIGNTPITLTQASGTATLSFLAGSDFAGNITASFPSISFDQARFRGNVSFTKTGNSGNNIPGGCTFDGSLNFTNATAGQVVFSNVNGDTYNGAVTLNNSGNTIFYIAHNGATTQFNNTVSLNSTGTSQGFRFCQGSGSANFATGAALAVGVNGFNSGQLRLKNITEAGGSNWSFNLPTSTSRMYFETGNTFNSPFTVTAPQVYLNGTRFNNNFTATFNSTTSYTSNGGNSFYGTTTLNNTGTATHTMAGTSADAFQGNLIVNVSNTNALINLCNTASGNVLNGNVTMTSTGGAAGVRFGQGNGSTTMRDGAEFIIGAGGFSSGSLRFRNVTQLGSESQDLILTSSAQLYLENGSVFNAALNFSAPLVYITGGTFNGITRLSQTGATSTTSTGGATFNGATFLTLSGNNSWVLGSTTGILFNNTLNVSNTGNNVLYLAHGATGHEFNGTITLNSTGTSQGIRFGQNGGTSTLGSAASIEIGASGFTAGSLRIRNMTQSGSTAITMSSNTAAVALYLETGNTFGGNVNFDFHQLYLNGTTFNGTTTLNQRGTTTITSNGGNVFNGTTLITNTGTGEMRLANTTADDYNGNVTFRNTTANRIFPAYATSVTFAGNVSTVGSAAAVSLCPTTGNGRVVFDGSANQTLGGDASLPPTIRNLTMSKTGSNKLTLSSNVTISNNITLTTGNIVSGSSSLLILNDNVTATGANNASHVEGPVRKIGNDAFTFPVGKVGYYRPISISAPGNTTHHFTATYFYANSNSLYPHSSKAASINHLNTTEYWILDRTNGTSNVVVTLSWGATSGSVTNSATLQVCRWNGTQWADHGNGGVAGSTVASSGAVTSFSPFTLGSQNTQNPLPIELLSFTGTATQGGNLLEWQTASELNNHFFKLERSSDLKSYSEVHRCDGAGNSNSLRSYSFTDTKPEQGVSYYRLIQTDFDGTETIYGPVAVYNAHSELDLTVYPNPFESNLFVKTGTEFQEGKVTVRIIDPLGRICYQSDLNAGPAQDLWLSLPEGAPGLYTMEFVQNDLRTYRKLLRK